MANVTFPTLARNAQTQEIDLVSATDVFRSAFNGVITTQGRGGEFLRVTLGFLNVEEPDRSLLRSFLASLYGRENRVIWYDVAHVQQGAFGGTPLVAGASQTGKSIAIDGASNNITDWIVAGDWFSIGNVLRMATANASSDGGGNVTISCWPRFQFAPTDNAAVTVVNPPGRFVLDSPSVTIVDKPGRMSDFSFSMIEDVAQ